jgi:SET domain-containing protein
MPPVLARVRTHARARAYFNVPNEHETQTLRSGRRAFRSQEPRKTAKRSDPSARKKKGRRIQARRSGVHGRGVYAIRKIKKGETIIEYKGEMITWKQAERRHPHNPEDPDHTFFFHIDDKHVIDASVGGNAARWINHACSPNCIADEVDSRIFIKARKAIKAGDELFWITA